MKYQGLVFTLLTAIGLQTLRAMESSTEKRKELNAQLIQYNNTIYPVLSHLRRIKILLDSKELSDADYELFKKQFEGYQKAIKEYENKTFAIMTQAAQLSIMLNKVATDEYKKLNSELATLSQQISDLIQQREKSKTSE
jgi:hypothetical protein